MKKLILFGFILNFSQLTWAAYPPFAATALYIKAVIDDPRVVQEMGITSAIESVRMNGHTIEVKAAGCTLDVEVHSLPVTGPISPSAVPAFELLIGTKICR